MSELTAVNEFEQYDGDNVDEPKETQINGCNHDSVTNVGFIQAIDPVLKISKENGNGSYVLGLIQTNQLEILYDIMRVVIPARVNFDASDERGAVEYSAERHHTCCEHCYCEQRLLREIDEAIDCELPAEFRKICHPESTKPVALIKYFLERNGDKIWVNIAAQNFDSICELAGNGVERLQHPLTGNTIFHQDLTMVYLYRHYNASLFHVQNWDGFTPKIPDFCTFLESVK